MSENLLKKVIEERNRVHAEAKNYLDAVEREGRSFTESDPEWTRLTARLGELNARAEELSEVIKSHDAATEAREFMAQAIKGERRSGVSSWLPGLGEYRELRAEQRTVNTSGAFIPVAYSETFFDQIRKRVGVLDAGPMIMPVEGAGSARVPVVRSSVSVTSYGESATIATSDPGLDFVTLDPKKLAALTKVTTEALEDSKPELRVVIANSLVKDLAVELDRQLVNGNGTGANILGLLNQPGLTAGPSTGTNGTALSFSLLADTAAAYEAADNVMESATWLMHPRTWASVRKLQDSQGMPIFAQNPTEALRPTIFGRPVYLSSNIPTNVTQGTATDTTSLLLFDASQVVIGVARQVELKISEDQYFTSDEVGMRVTCRYDLALPQPTAVVKTSGIRP